jgi:hypothetical protein
VNTGALIDAVLELAGVIGERIEDERVEREHRPCLWAYYHRSMVGRVGRLRRWWHRRRVRKYEALCAATSTYTCAVIWPSGAAIGQSSYYCGDDVTGSCEW